MQGYALLDDQTWKDIREFLQRGERNSACAGRIPEASVGLPYKRGKLLRHRTRCRDLGVKNAQGITQVMGGGMRRRHIHLNIHAARPGLIEALRTRRQPRGHRPVPARTPMNGHGMNESSLRQGRI